MYKKTLTKRSLISEMDQSVKQMLKLIQEDGDSFAKKAEMYYQKRPELISHVEEFYRMYRSLAERYDHVTGELRKSIPSDLQSQGSGISDIGSEPTSTWPSPDQRLSRRKVGPRAAGFDVFLGSAGSSSDVYQKEGDESSSLTDSEPDSDDSSVNNYSVLSGNGDDQGPNRRIMELEMELREAKEKLRLQEEENADGSVRGANNYGADNLLGKIAGYEQELRIANEKIQLSEDEITRLRIQLQKYNSVETAEFESSKEKNRKTEDAEVDFETNQTSTVQQRTGILEEGIRIPDGKFKALVEELKITKERLEGSEKEIDSLKLENKQYSEKIQKLQGQLELAQKDVVAWKSKLNTEKREVSKLQERIARLKTSLSDRDHEIRDLKEAVSDAEQKIFPEKAQIKAEIAKVLEERTHLVEQLREWESRGRSLEEEIKKVLKEKTDSEARLRGEIGLLKVEIARKGDCIKNLNDDLDALKTVREEFNGEVNSLKAEVSSRDDRIDQMDKHLQQLHMEHMELVARAEGARKQAEELKERTKELEDEVDRQRITILEGAEEKREAIRQLCFSLEHYRNGYHRLRQAFMGYNKRVPVLAS